MRSLLLLLFFVALAGCNSSGNSSVDIRASNYDQTCTQASDCMIISEGSCCPQCAFAAISKAGAAAYQEDEKKRQAACVGAKCALPPCAAPELACMNGKCSLCLGGNCFDSGAQTDSGSDATSDAPKD